MSSIEQFQMYPVAKSRVYFPQGTKYDVIIYPENVDFLDVYPLMNFRKVDIRFDQVYKIAYPKVNPDSALLDSVRRSGLKPVRLNMQTSGNQQDKNIDEDEKEFKSNKPSTFIDFTYLLNALDKQFKKGLYSRSVIQKRIEAFIQLIKNNQAGRKSAFIYVIDINKPFQKIPLYKRIYPIYKKAVDSKTVNIFDYFILCIIKNGKPVYSLLSSNNKPMSIQKFSMIIKQLTPRLSKDEKIFNDVNDLKVDFGGNDIEDDVINIDSDEFALDGWGKVDIKNKNNDSVYDKQKINDLTDSDRNVFIKNRLPIHTIGFSDSRPAKIDKIHLVKDDKSKRIATLKIIKDNIKGFTEEVKDIIKKSKTPAEDVKVISLSQVVRPQISKLKLLNTIRNMPSKDKHEVTKQLEKDVGEQALPQFDAVNTSRDPVVSNIDIPKIVDNKNPKGIINKRVVEYHTQFGQDLYKILSLFENKDYPLKIVSFTKVDVPIPPGDLYPSYYDSYEIDMEDDLKHLHHIQIQVPTMFQDGTFIINGDKKYVIYQLVVDPVYFLVKDEGKLGTNYAKINVQIKRTRTNDYFEAYIGGVMNVPLFAFFGFFYGFDETCKLFDIDWEIYDKGSQINLKSNLYLTFALEDDKTLVVYYKTETARYLLNSIKVIPYKFSSQNFRDKKSYESAFVTMTGNRNSIYALQEVSKNIMEPIAVDVLKSKHMPTTLEGILKYICDEVVRGRIDSRNDLNIQRVRSTEVFLAPIEKLALGAYGEYRFKRLAGDSSAKYFIDTRKCVSDIVNSKLVRKLENINPIEELSCLTRTTPMGDGGVPNDRAVTKDLRDISQSYYGSIDSMDTPEGCLTNDTKVKTPDGLKFISDLNPFIDKIMWRDGTYHLVIGKQSVVKREYVVKLEDGREINCSYTHKFPVYDNVDKIERVFSLDIIMKDIDRYAFIQLTLSKIDYIKIKSIIDTDKYSDMTDIQVNTPDNTFVLENGIIQHNSNVGIVNQLTIDPMVVSDRGSFKNKDNPDDKSGVLSVNSVVIPYVNSTDGCRVMFSGQQGRQAVPIVGNEVPMTQTGYESLLTNCLSDSYVIRAPMDGYITGITDRTIHVQNEKGMKQNVSIEPRYLSSGQGLSSINYFTPIVKLNQYVKSGQIIAEGRHIKDGTIAIGANLLTGVMMYDGYSFEDGYIVSDRISDKVFVSYAYYKDKDYNILVRPDQDVKFIVEEGAITKTGEPLMIISQNEVEDLLGLQDNDEIVDGQLVKKSPGGKVISIEVYLNDNIENYPKLKKQFEIFKRRYEENHGKYPQMHFINKVASTKEVFKGVLVQFKIERQMKCELGDKITNNFGGKGTITRIVPHEQMPKTPWGEHLDLIINPLAIVNRMNPSTIKELYTGLIQKFMTNKFLLLGAKKNPAAIDFVYKTMLKLDATKNKDIATQVYRILSQMSEKQYYEYYMKVKERGFIPIIVPQFQNPTLPMIQDALKFVGAKSGYKLGLPQHGKTTEYDIAVGYLYYKKLEQQTSIKVSARSTGASDSVTGQATQGKSRGGGQKLGEYDVMSYLSHGAVNLLREFMGPLSDDSVTKNEIIADIIQTGNASYRQPQVQPTKNLLDVYITGIMIQPTNKIK